MNEKLNLYSVAFILFGGNISRFFEFESDDHGETLVCTCRKTNCVNAQIFRLIFSYFTHFSCYLWFQQFATCSEFMFHSCSFLRFLGLAKLFEALTFSTCDWSNSEQPLREGGGGGGRCLIFQRKQEKRIVCSGLCFLSFCDRSLEMSHGCEEIPLFRSYKIINHTAKLHDFNSTFKF